MPTIVTGNSTDNSSYWDVKDPVYEYPKDRDISPGSNLSQKILTTVCRMAENSYRVMSQRHQKWNDIDNTMKVYIKPDEYEKKLKALDPRRPTSIVVPYSYATIETIMAYLTKSYLGDSVLQYEGFGPEDTIGAKLLELACNQQVRRFKSDLEMHISMRDSLTYGIGPSTVVWSESWGKRPFIDEIPIYSRLGGERLGSKKIRVNRSTMLFEGNETIAIDPYKYLPDPNTSIHNIHRGDFNGWIEFVSYSSLLSDEASGLGYSNVRWLRTGRYASKSSKYTADGSQRMSKKDATFKDTFKESQYVTVIHMYVRIIPKDWGLKSEDPDNSRGELPEIWLFSVANEQLVIRCAPLNLNHNKFPVAVAAPDFDGYSITPISRMELIDGLQTVLNWLFNSHIANVRKAINDMLIVDPSLVNMEDLENPNPGKLIRLRRSAWGKGVNDAVKQLQITDITRQNMVDAEQVMSLMQKASAATDATMGVQRSGGERVTAQEFSGTMQMAVSRLEHIGRMVSSQYLLDIGYFYASHTQQLMSQDIYAKCVGNWPDELMDEFNKNGIDPTKPIAITPDQLMVDYDVIFRDGATATATALENDFWSRNFQSILSSDKLGMFDAPRIFKHMARINGAKNVGDFINKGGMFNAITESNSDIANEVEAGNLVPLDEFS